MANSVVNQVKVGSTTYDMKPYLGSATSGDAASATAWTAVDAIATSDSYDTVFNKVTKMVKNVRYLYSKLGTTDFSAIGSTTSAALVALNNGKSATTHNHDGVYSATNHTHSNYSTTGHTHSNYSTTGHTHSNYASSTHNHDSAYAAKTHSHSEYSTTGHTHSNYSTTGHTHSNYSTTGHTHSYIATSNIVTSQTNSTSKVPAASLVYSMNTTLSSLNDAMPNKLNIGDYGIGNKAITITNQNLLNYKVSGFYTGGNVTNAPDANWWYFEVISHDNVGFVKYIAYPIYTNNNIYTARLENGTFSGWSVYDADAIKDLQNKVNGIVDADNPLLKTSNIYFKDNIDYPPYSSNYSVNCHTTNNYFLCPKLENTWLKIYIYRKSDLSLATTVNVTTFNNLSKVENIITFPSSDDFYISVYTGSNTYDYFYKVVTNQDLTLTITYYNSFHNNFIPSLMVIKDGYCYCINMTTNMEYYTYNLYVAKFSDSEPYTRISISNQVRGSFSTGANYPTFFFDNEYIHMFWFEINTLRYYKYKFQDNTLTQVWSNNDFTGDYRLYNTNNHFLYFKESTSEVYYLGGYQYYNKICKFNISNPNNKSIVYTIPVDQRIFYYAFNLGTNKVVFLAQDQGTTNINIPIIVLNIDTDSVEFSSIFTKKSPQMHINAFDTYRMRSKIIVPSTTKYIPITGAGFLENNNGTLSAFSKQFYDKETRSKIVEAQFCELGYIFINIGANSGITGFLPFSDFESNISYYVSSGPKIEYVTRVGTGSSSSSSPCQISFNFVPKCIMCLGVKDTNYTGLQFPNLGTSNSYKEVLALTIWTDLLTTSYASYILGNTNYNAMGNFTTLMKKSEDGKTISWYGYNSGNDQRILNASGCTYYFLAFGE